MLDLLQPQAREVIADRTRLSQILMNYGSNAIKYGRSGGKARFQVAVSDGTARVSVIDDGIGLAIREDNEAAHRAHARQRRLREH